MAPDVIVVGAGLAGLATAWHLAPHARVLVVDQAEQVGAEATSQNAGMVRRMGEDPYERALAIRTAAWMAEPGDDWAERSPSRIVGAVLGLRDDPHHLHDAAAHLKARGVAVERLDRPAEVAPALAGSPVEVAWYLPDERVADAWSQVQGFLHGIARHGGRVELGRQVLRLRAASGRIAGVDTDAGAIGAERVVLATGAWSRELARGVGLDRPLVPLRRTLLQTAAHPLSRPDHPWVWVDDAGVYARPEGPGWLVSGCDEAVDPPATGPGSRGPVDPEIRARALDKLETWFPPLADLRFTSGWSGLRTFAPDRRPVLGQDPDLAGLWWVAGLGGFGVTCAYAAGEAVATWMRGRATPWLSPRGVSPGRTMPRRLPIRPWGDLGSATLLEP